MTEATAKRPGGVHGEAAGVVPGAIIHEEQRRFGMANWVLSRQRQAADRAGRTGEPFGEAMDAALGAEAGRQLGKPRDGPHGNEGPDGGRIDLPRERAKERGWVHREALGRIQVG